MKLRSVCLAMVAIVLFGACQREGTGQIELIIEQIGTPNAKLAVQQDSMAVWNAGDIINFNGTQVPVVRDNNGHAYISDAASQTVNSACFPADLCQSNINAPTVTVSLPAEYHYRTSGGAQLLDMPIMARAAEGNPLRFRHLTAALCLILTNTQGVPLTIDYITVASDAYQLSGERTIDMDDLETVDGITAPEGPTRQVTMLFDRQRLVLNNNETCKVLIPVPPVGANNHFSVTVSSRHEGGRYNYSSEQHSGGELPRNMLAYAAFGMKNATPTDLFDAAGGSPKRYHLRRSTDLVALAEAANAGWSMTSGSTLYRACNYSLANDIDMTDVPFDMIATYTGTHLYGNNHTISHLTINGTNGYCAFFKNPNGLTVQNLTLSDVTLKHSAYNAASKTLYLGALIANVTGGAVLTSCSVNGLTIDHAFSGKANDIRFGGLVGYLQGGGTLSSCSATITSTGYTFDATNCYYGSLLGYCTSSGASLTLNTCTVTNSALTITSTQNLAVGGIVAFSSGNKISLLSGCTWSSAMAVESTYASTPTPTVYAGRLIGQYTSGSNGSRDVSGASATDSISVTKSGVTTTVTKDIGNL